MQNTRLAQRRFVWQLFILFLLCYNQAIFAGANQAIRVTRKPFLSFFQLRSGNFVVHSFERTAVHRAGSAVEALVSGRDRRKGRVIDVQE
jgi:hypothetical protein